jgi:hypothetical protein
MKKLLAILAIVALSALPALAHVLLTVPYSQSGPSGVLSCSAPHLTMTNSAWTWGTNGGANTISITYSFGTATFTGGVDTNFAVAACAPTLTNVLNLTTGQWTLTSSATGTVVSGVLSGPQLTGAVAATLGRELR